MDFDKVHELIESKTKLNIVASGQNNESLPHPFITYQVLREPKYREYQKLRVVNPVTPFEKKEVFPTSTEVQYTVYYESDQVYESREMIRKLYRYICSDEFAAAMKKADVAEYSVLSEIREISVNKGDYFERQLNFDVRYIWPDMETNPKSDVIDEVGVVEEVPPDVPPQ
jgi:hypothetical protein